MLTQASFGIALQAGLFRGFADPSCLRDCGPVTAHQHGRVVHYSLNDDLITNILLVADELLADVARGIPECTRYDAYIENPNG